MGKFSMRIFKLLVNTKKLAESCKWIQPILL